MKKKSGLIDDVVEVVISQNVVSAPFIQRHFKVDYVTTQEVLHMLEELGYIQKGAECTTRKVLKNHLLQ